MTGHVDTVRYTSVYSISDFQSRAESSTYEPEWQHSSTHRST